MASGSLNSDSYWGGEEKVDRWLKELLQLGFIRRKIAGLSDSLYADTKVTSSYILNLNHPGLASADCSSPVVAFMVRQCALRRAAMVLRSDLRGCKGRFRA